MNSHELRAAQLPLKKQFRDDPRSAMHTLRAEGRLNQDRLSVKVLTGAGRPEAGLHPATGGDGTLACSGDMLLEALAACAGVTLLAVATAMDITIKQVKPASARTNSVMSTRRHAHPRASIPSRLVRWVAPT
jgi:organic hydroperoxide reductase OsmC/OhrA